MAHFPHLPWRGRLPKRLREEGRSNCDQAREDRPYFTQSYIALCRVVADHQNDPDVLHAVVHELFHRREMFARELRVMLLRRLERLEGEHYTAR